MLSCGMKEHTHEPYVDWWNTGCYDWQGNKLTCGETEHTHANGCYTSTSTYDPLPTKPGYTFEGWFADEACKTPAEKSVTLEKM